jgi:hypothetical protein
LCWRDGERECHSYGCDKGYNSFLHLSFSLVFP